ncbi:MAG: hypothetical protein OEY23_11235 [Acidimicrobiia bacterium]|nr:hypothetical protein [Acidimicrobiia bacterium]
MRPLFERARIAHLITCVILLCGGLVVHGNIARPTVAGASELDVLWGPEFGCFDLASYGTGLLGDGAGTIFVPPAKGQVVAAYLQWVGADDASPQEVTEEGRADSTLTVQGRDVVGTQPANGYGAAAQFFGFSRGWFIWYADLGPAGENLISEDGGSISISGWDNVELLDGRNGATITIVYDLGDCGNVRQASIYSGMDIYFHGLPEAGYGEHSFATQLFGLPFDSIGTPRLVTINLFHGGADSHAETCRGEALWVRTGSGPVPGDALDHLVDHGPGGAGVGANEGVELVNDPFPSKACTLRVAPAPDVPYEPGHPYPLGASVPSDEGGAPYRLVSVDAVKCSCPPGDEAEWNEVRVTLELPPGAEWVLLQLESEADQNGESGAWGGSFVVVEPLYPPTTTTTTTTVPTTTTTTVPTTTTQPPPDTTPAGLVTVGDRVWFDRDANGIQDDGDGAQSGVDGVRVTLLDGRTGQAVDFGEGPVVTRTDRNGAYLFDRLPVGSYAVRFDPATLPPGHRFTATDQGGDDLDSDADPSGRTPPTAELPAGSADLRLDAGVVRLAPGQATVRCLPTLRPGVAFEVSGRVGDGGGAPHAILLDGFEVDRFEARGDFSRVVTVRPGAHVVEVRPLGPGGVDSGPMPIDTSDCVAVLAFTGSDSRHIPLTALAGAAECLAFGWAALAMRRRLLGAAARP